MLEIIIAYLIGIVAEYNLNLDGYSYFFFFVIYLIISCVIYIYKRHQKDIGFGYNYLGKILLITAVFILASQYTKLEMQTVSYKYIKPGIYEVGGKVVSMKQSINSKTLTVEVETIKNLEDSQADSYQPKYVNTNVSLFSDYEIFDYLKIVGELTSYTGADFYNNKPFLFSYEYMKLSENVFYSLNYPKHIEKIPIEKNFYETYISLFLSKSYELKNRVSQHMQEPYASIASGISTGNQEGMTNDIKDIFRNSGLIHLLVLSGANVAAIISFAWIIVQRVKTKYIFPKVVTLIFISWIFIFATGLTPPAIRAGVMASVSILAEYFMKNISSGYALLLALFFLTFLNPLLLINSPSLHLSFLACVAIFIVAPNLEKYLKSRFPKIDSLVIFFASFFIGLFIIMTPYILAMTGQSPIFGTVLTFFAEPLIIISTGLTFLTIVSSYINSFLADLFGLINSYSISGILFLAEFGSEKLPQIKFNFSKTYLIIYYIFIFGLFYWFNKSEVEPNKKQENGDI